MNVWVVMSSQGQADCIGIAKTQQEGIIMAVQSWTTKNVDSENLSSVMKKKGLTLEQDDDVAEIYDNPTPRATWDCVFVIQKKRID